MHLHYVQVEADWVDSREASDMADRLALSSNELLGFVLRFWCWARYNAAPRGRIGGRNPVRAVEEAVRWSGKPGAFVKAAIEEGGILRWDGEELEVRGWQKRYGAALLKAQKDAERKRGARTSSGQARGRRADVQRTAPGKIQIQNRDQDLDPDHGSSTNRESGHGDQDLGGDRERKEFLPPPSESAPSAPVVVVVEDAQGRKHDCTTPGGFWGAVSAFRAEHDLPRELEPPSWSAWYARATSEVGPELLLDAYFAYRRDEHFRDRAWPTAIFTADGVWRPRARAPEPERRRL